MMSREMRKDIAAFIDAVIWQIDAPLVLGAFLYRPILSMDLPEIPPSAYWRDNRINRVMVSDLRVFIPTPPDHRYATAISFDLGDLKERLYPAKLELNIECDFDPIPSFNWGFEPSAIFSTTFISRYSDVLSRHNEVVSMLDAIRVYVAWSDRDYNLSFRFEPIKRGMELKAGYWDLSPELMSFFRSEGAGDKATNAHRLIADRMLKQLFSPNEYQGIEWYRRLLLEQYRAVDFACFNDLIKVCKNQNPL